MDTAAKRVNSFRSPLDQAISAKTGLMPPPVTMEDIGKRGLFQSKYDPVSVRQPYQKEEPETIAPTETKLDRAGASEYLRLVKEGTDPAQARLQALQHQETTKKTAELPKPEPVEEKGAIERLDDSFKKSATGFVDVLENVAEGTAEQFARGSRQLGASAQRLGSEGLLKAPGNILSGLSDVATIAASPAAGLASAWAKEVGKAVDIIPEDVQADIAKAAETALPYGTKEAADYVTTAIENMSPEQKANNKAFLDAVNVLATVSGAATAPSSAGTVAKALDSTVGRATRGIDDATIAATQAVRGMERPGFLGGKKPATIETAADVEVPVMKGTLETPSPIVADAVTPDEQAILGGLEKRSERGIIGGQEVDIPLPFDRNILEKGLSYTAKKFTPTATVQKLADRALTPSYAGKTARQTVDTIKNTEKNVRQLHELVRTKQLAGDLTDLSTTAETVVNGLDDIGAQIGKSIDSVDPNVRVGTLSPELNVQIGEVLANDIQKRAAAYKVLENFIADTQKELSVKDAFAAKRIYQSEISKLIKAWDAGTDSYAALVKGVQGLSDQIDEAVAKVSDSGDFKTLKKRYALLKSLANDISKSAQVEARSSPMTFTEQVGMLQGMTDLIKNPVRTTGNALMREIGQMNSRGGAWKQLVERYDEDAIKELKKTRAVPKSKNESGIKRREPNERENRGMVGKK